ncbi:tyrosine-type recombinase/integrase [Tsukamurella strandjordii]|uniref:Tyrosine-type recombinase/integrase n=1 Tax=Tsukamurella strandjordii TaxID=147577 RepID=A0AA90NK67_9ACTN|nr:tyrosine-type recombinase/integrase [Tsukamurella strandjordii]MDP0400513.1 tyrosine-type recombinase/integrase [Tsukamurella strandjordii]
MTVAFVSMRAVDEDGEDRFVVVDSESFELHEDASSYLESLRRRGCSGNTMRVYAGRVALLATWCSFEGLNCRELDFRSLSRFMSWVAVTPYDESGQLRSANTVNQVITSAMEFVRFGCAQGWIPSAVADQLSTRRHIGLVPGYDRGDEGQFAVIRGRTLRKAAAAPELQWLSLEQLQAVTRATANHRDRLLVMVLAVTGMRIGEALGMRREDIHLLPSSASLGCAVSGPHLHVRRRINANNATAKSRYPRWIPVSDDLTTLYVDYQTERSCRIADDADTDFVFVNLYQPPLAAGMRYSNAYRVFINISKQVGFRVRPHMLRHSAATHWIDQGAQRDAVQHLLGHVSAVSTERYVHPTEAAMRAAVEHTAAIWRQR